MTTDTHTTQTTTNPARPTNGIPVQRAQAQAQPAITWFRPAVDVLEGAEALLLVLDVPGVAPSAFEIQTENRSLVVSGVRTDGERGWRRAFTLPPTVDPSKITARAENGVLYVTLPKAEEARPRKITVA
ncbi:MAG: Hsp20/alpha crystallin family protein [Myxococcota bacterium]